MEQRTRGQPCMVTCQWRGACSSVQSPGLTKSARACLLLKAMAQHQLTGSAAVLLADSKAPVPSSRPAVLRGKQAIASVPWCTAVIWPARHEQPHRTASPRAISTSTCRACAEQACSLRPPCPRKAPRGRMPATTPPWAAAPPPPARAPAARSPGGGCSRTPLQVGLRGAGPAPPARSSSPLSRAQSWTRTSATPATTARCTRDPAGWWLDPHLPGLHLPVSLWDVRMLLWLRPWLPLQAGSCAACEADSWLQPGLEHSCTLAAVNLWYLARPGEQPCRA